MLNLTDSLVSIIIPCYNASEYIGEALQSVYDQSFTKIEIIVVDDGSTDRSPELISKLKNVISIRQENSGPAAARNRGLELAKGEFIAFLDADDVYPKQKLRIQLKELANAPELLFISGGIHYFGQNICKRVLPFYDQIEEKSVSNFQLGACLFRKEVFDLVGNFNEELHHAEDVDWWMKVLEQKVPFRIVKETTLYYRLHDGNMTNNRSVNESFFVKALKMSLDRRRKLNDGKTFELDQITGSDDKSFRPRTKNPLVSIIMIVKNGEKFIREALTSIIDQNYRPIEIILIDGHSTDSTKEIVLGQHPEIKYVLQNGQGIPQAYNQGIELAEGKYIAFLSADDVWTPKKLVYQINVMHNDPQIKYSITEVEFFQDGKINEDKFDASMLGKRLPGYIMETLVVRKETFQEFGLLNNNFKTGEDLEWFSRMRDCGVKGEVVNRCFTQKRIHANNFTLAQNTSHNRAILDLARLSIRRKKIRNLMLKIFNRLH